MLRLILMRHAKSRWRSPGLGDFERPLAERGRRDAPRMGAYLAAAGFVPDVVLCSSAKRARQTMKRAIARFSREPELRLMDELYHAGPDDLLAILRRIDSALQTVMIIGHNPGLHTLALDLIRPGVAAGQHLHDNLEHHFPTAALAVLSFDVRRWRNLAEASGKLEDYTAPRLMTG